MEMDGKSQPSVTLPSVSAGLAVAWAHGAEILPRAVSLEASVSGSWSLWFCFCSHVRPWEPWEMKFGALSF